MLFELKLQQTYTKLELFFTFVIFFLKKTSVFTNHILLEIQIMLDFLIKVYNKLNKSFIDTMSLLCFVLFFF